MNCLREYAVCSRHNNLPGHFATTLDFVLLVVHAMEHNVRPQCRTILADVIARRNPLGEQLQRKIFVLEPSKRHKHMGRDNPVFFHQLIFHVTLSVLAKTFKNKYGTHFWG